jgi:membrane protein
MKNFLEKLYVKTLDDEVFGRSAEIAFYFFFSLFPFLFFLVSLFGLVLRESNDLEARFFLYLKQIMPIEAYDLIEKTIREVAEKSSGSKITLGFLIAIWSASSGFDSFQTALNRIYNLQETRSILKLKLISLILTIVSGFLALLTVVLNFEGFHILSNLLPTRIFDFLKMFEPLIVIANLFLILALIYNFCPNKERKRWQWISWGLVAAIGLWLLLSASFNLYLQYFNTYAKVYGSLGAVIILMLWFYLTALVILIGAEIDVILFQMRQGV